MEEVKKNDIRCLRNEWKCYIWNIFAGTFQNWFLHIHSHTFQAKNTNRMNIFTSFILFFEIAKDEQERKVHKVIYQIESVKNEKNKQNPTWFPSTQRQTSSIYDISSGMRLFLNRKCKTSEVFEKHKWKDKFFSRQIFPGRKRSTYNYLTGGTFLDGKPKKKNVDRR